MDPNSPQSSPGSAVRAYAFRLTPGHDLKQRLLAFAKAEGLRAAAVVTAVGSLTTVRLRLANQQQATVRHGHFEIVALVGTATGTAGHLHLAVADETGAMFGGHLLDGCTVYTTAEIVLAELTGANFTRELDPTFGYNELVVGRREI